MLALVWCIYVHHCCCVQGVKCVVAGFLLLVVIPLLLGHLVDLVIITPLRVPSNRTPLFYPSTVSQDTLQGVCGENASIYYLCVY